MPPFGAEVGSNDDTSANRASQNRGNASKGKAVLHDILTAFVSDAMRDRPQDVLTYMAEWAASRQSSGASSPKQISGARSDVLELEPSPHKIFPGETLINLARSRQQYFKDSADGVKDHYLISLEESDYDIFQLNNLQKKLYAAREEAATAEAEVKEIVAQLKKIDEAKGSNVSVIKDQENLLCEYQERWKDHPIKKRR